MIGPVLIKQERNEAQSNVGKRIDFINSELYVGLLAHLSVVVLPSPSFLAPFDIFFFSLFFCECTLLIYLKEEVGKLV